MLPNEPEILDARLGFADAQVALNGAVDKRIPETATVGWYGTDFHDERGSLAIVATSSPLAYLVGDRIKLSYERGPVSRSVVVYVFGSADLPDGWDLGVPRRPFMALERPTKDPIDVIVETLID